MPAPWFVSTGLILVAMLCSAWAAEMGKLDANLEPLRPFLEKTYTGVFKSSTSEKPVVDVLRWERALNGKAVRSFHSINNGVYGGETIYTWDEEAKAIRYHYFTTAGFMTTGTMTFKDGKFHTVEKISGQSGGVSEVRAVSEIKPDGSFHVKTEQLRNGEWTPGHEVTYKEDAAAKVVFK